MKVNIHIKHDPRMGNPYFWIIEKDRRFGTNLDCGSAKTRRKAEREIEKALKARKWEANPATITDELRDI